MTDPNDVPGPKNNDNDSAFSKVKEIEVSTSFVAPGGTHMETLQPPFNKHESDLRGTRAVFRLLSSGNYCPIYIFI